MAASAQGVASSGRSNGDPGAGDPSSSSSFRPVYIVEPLPGCQDSFSLTPSRTNGCSLSLSSERSSSTQRHQHIFEQSPNEQWTLAAAEGQRVALKSVWNYAGTSVVPRIMSRGAPLDTGSVQKNGGRLHVSRPPALPFASACFLPSSRAIAPGTRLPPAEYTRPAFLRPTAEVPGKTYLPQGRIHFPPEGIIPTCFYPENFISVQAGGALTENSVLAYRTPGAETGVPKERPHAGGTPKEVKCIGDGRAHAVFSGRQQYFPSLAVGFAQASPTTNSVKNSNTEGSDRSITTSSKHGRETLSSLADQEEPISSRVAGGAHRAAETPTTRKYTVLMQQSHVKGGQQMQVTASFALPGAVVQRKVPLTGPTAALGSSGAHCPLTHSFCSPSPLFPPTSLLGSRNPTSPAASYECRRHCSPTRSRTRDCSVPAIVSLRAKQRLEQVGSKPVQQRPGFQEGQQQRRHYLQDTFQTLGEPACLQVPRWWYCVSKCPQKLNYTHSAHVNPAPGDEASLPSHAQVFAEPCTQPIERRGETGSIWEWHRYDQHHQLQQLYRRRRQQSAGGMQTATDLPDRGDTSLARCAPMCEVRVMQRSRSHPPKASLSQSSTEEALPTSSSTHNGWKEWGKDSQLFRASHYADAQYKEANAVGLEKHCKLRSSHSGTLDARGAKVFQSSPAASSPAVPSAAAHSDYTEHKTVKAQHVEKDHYGRIRPPGHVVWQQVPGSSQAGQIQRPSAAPGHADAFAAQKSTGAVFAVPPFLTANFSAETGVCAAAISPAAGSLAPAALIHSRQQESHKDSHYPQRRTESSFSLMQKEEKGLFCEGALLRGGEADAFAAGSSRTTSTTSTGLLRFACSDSRERIFDASGHRDPLSSSHADPPQEVDRSACTIGRQSCFSVTETRADTPFTSIDKKTVEKFSRNKAEEEQEDAAFKLEARLSSLPAEEPDAKEDRRALETGDFGDGKPGHRGTTNTTSEQASGESESRLLSQEKECSHCTVAVRRRESSCQESRSVSAQWADGLWAGLRLSAACSYSTPVSRREEEEHAQELQEDHHYEKRELESATELDATSELTSSTQTVADGDLYKSEVTGIHQSLESKNRKTNAHKSDREGKGNGLPWKSVIVNTKNCRVEKALINTCAQRLGWGRNDVDAFKGHIVWLGGSAPDFEHLHYNKPIQVINRFPGMWDMTKKRMLYRILSLYGQLFPTEYDFFPACWSLPEDRVLIEQMLHGKNKKFYILKPDGGARGNGVQLVSLYKDIDPMVLRGDGSYIMQKYVENPYLLNKKKFDFRIYCVLFSVSGVPKAYVSKLGMVRFCTEEYQTPSRKNIDNPFMHLTNYSINKDNLYSFVRSTDLHDDTNSKRLLKDVFEELAQAGVDTDMVWQQIKNITAKTIVCLQPWLNLRYRHIYRGRPTEPSRCFQLLGLDILLDRNNKCWLLEVNSNPSLRIDYFDSKYDGIDVQLESAVDRHIKEPVVTEALTLAYRVLLQHRQPYVQPLPRCCSRNKQTWYLRKPAAATAQVTGKQAVRSRSQLGRCSVRIKNCCSGSEEEEETETEEAVATGRGTCAAGTGGGRGRGAFEAGESKARAMLATGSTATRKAGGSAAMAGGKAVEGAAAARRAPSTAIEERASATTRGGRAPGLKKRGFSAETAVEEDGRHTTGNTSNDSRTASSKQAAPGKRLAGQQRGRREEKGGRQLESCSSESAASARSAESLQQRRLSVLNKRSFERRRPSNSRTKLGQPSVEGMAGAVQGGRGLNSERTSCVRLRTSSAAAADRTRRKGGQGDCCTPAATRTARTKNKNKRSMSIYDAASKQAEEENEDYSDAKVCISPKRAVEEARKLLERLGPAAALQSGALERSPASSPGSGRSSGVECMQQSKATLVSLPGIYAATPHADAATAAAASAAGASSLHHFDSTPVKRSVPRTPTPGPRELCSGDLEEKYENAAAVPLLVGTLLSPAAEAARRRTLSPNERTGNSETTRCVRKQQSVGDTSRSEGEKEAGKRGVRGTAAAATGQEGQPLLHSSSMPTSGPVAVQASERSLSTDARYPSAAAAAAKQAEQPNTKVEELEGSCSLRMSGGEGIEGATQDTRGKNTGVKTLSRKRCCSTKMSGSTAFASCPPFAGADTFHRGTADDLEDAGEAGKEADLPHCNTSSDTNSESGCEGHFSATRATCTLASSPSVVSSYPPSPSQYERFVSEDEIQQGFLAEAGEQQEEQQQHCNGSEKAASKDEGLSCVKACVGDTTLQTTEASDKESGSPRGAHAGNGETRLATEAEQLAVKLEWIEEAYREMEKCMDRFNILGLRFASRTVSSSSASQQQYGGSSNGDGRQQGEGAAAGAINARRGGGGAPAAGAGRTAGGKDGGKRVGPYKPFLRKDKVASRSGNQTPPKSCYTKLHKDILHPLPPEYLKPQHCWVDLTPSIAPLMEKTACVLQVQLLFERIVGFPRLICLQREKLLEACRLVKLPDVLRKVQVPIASPPTSRSASSRFHAALRPPHVSHFSGASAVRVGGREPGGCFAASVAASTGGGPELSRSNSGPWLTAAAVGGRGGGTAAAAAGESLLSGSYNGMGFPGKRTHGRSSSRAGSSGTSTSATQLSKSTGVTTSAAAHQQAQQRQGAGCSSVSRLPACRGFVAGSIERRRRLGLPDLEVLFYAQLQGVRRQLQLQEASFGLGLLETWYLLEPIALVCYPFLPTKAKLLEAFMNPVAAGWHEKQRSGVQLRLLKSPLHADYASICKTKPRLEQMLQQLEEEDRLAFAAASGEPAAPGKGRRSRGRSRCREKTAAGRQEKASSSEAGKEETELGQCENATHDRGKSSSEKGGADLSKDVRFVPSNTNSLGSASATDQVAARPPHEQRRCTGLTEWESAAAGGSSAASPLEACTATAAALEVTKARSLRAASMKGAAPTKSTAAHTAEEWGVQGEGAAAANGRAAARKGSVAVAEAGQKAGETSVNGESYEFSSEYAEPPAAGLRAVQEQCVSPSVAETCAGSTVHCSRQQQQTRLAGIAAQQHQRSCASATSVKANNDMVEDGGCCVNQISSSSAAAASPPSAAACVFADDRDAHLYPDVATMAAESSAASALRCGDAHAETATAGNMLQEDATRQPLLFLWGHDQQRQRAFVEEPDIPNAKTHPCAQVQSDNSRTPHPASCTPVAPSLPAVAAASLCAGWSAAAASADAAAAESSYVMLENEQKGKESAALFQDAALHGAGETACCCVTSGPTPNALHVSPSNRGPDTGSHSGSSRGTTRCSLLSVPEEKGDEEECNPAKDLSQAAPHGVSAATAPGAAATTAPEIPDWHPGLCAAWSEDLWAYIRQSIPTEDRLAAMKRLVDYFHLRLDYCSFCALVPGGAGGGKV